MGAVYPSPKHGCDVITKQNSLYILRHGASIHEKRKKQDDDEKKNIIQQHENPVPSLIVGTLGIRKRGHIIENVHIFIHHPSPLQTIDIAISSGVRGIHFALLLWQVRKLTCHTQNI
jgi:hypothetical protein